MTKDASPTAGGSEEMAHDVTLNPRLHLYLIIYGISGIAIILTGILKAFSIGKVR